MTRARTRLPLTASRAVFTALCALAVALAVPTSAAPLAAPRDDAHERHAAAQALLDHGDYARAVDAYAQLVETHPDDALAWHNLALAHHLAGDYEAAHAANARGAELPALRGTSLYNMACASSRLDETQRAADELRRAVAAGFVDFDLMARDPDLAAVRDAGLAPLPAAREHASITHGGVTIPYTVLLPEGYDAARAYRAALVFAPGGQGPRSTDAMIDTLWADADARADWIVVCAVMPSAGWMSHPAHHALNALLKHVLKQHRVTDERFWFLGLQAGGRPAATYASMSQQFASGVTLVDSAAFARWDDDEIQGLARRRTPVTMIASAHDADVLAATRHAEELLRGANGDVRVQTVASDGPSLPTLDARRLLGDAAARLAAR